VKLVTFQDAKLLANMVAKKNFLYRIISYFTMIEQQFWKSETEHLCADTYDTMRGHKRKLIDDIYTDVLSRKNKLTRHNEVRDLVSSHISGETEVCCLFGRCDVMTSKYAIEVKNYKQWPHALGQALAYAGTERNAIVCLFDGMLDTHSEIVCQRAGVHVWYVTDDNKIIIH